MKERVIIIPAYNEARIIKSSLEKIINHFYNSVDIIVVCDGCRDETPKIVKNFA